MHGLPLTYNKDMQEDKEPLFDAADTLDLCLQAAAGMVSGLTFRRERMAAAAGDEMIAATDLADLLVRRGMPFREAHGVVAGLVRDSRRARRAAVGLLRRGARSATPSCSTTSAARVLGQRRLARVEGLRGRDVASRGCAEQLARARALLA